MKNRLTRVAYVLSFSFLAVTLYLNFIKRETNEYSVVSAPNKQASIKGTIIIDHSSENISTQKKSVGSVEHSL